MRRKKKDIDIYRILMLPLMTMFLLNIGLVATTWAWYTASVSSGVNSIKAGVDVSVEVFKEDSTEPIEVENYSISLEAGKEYTFTFTPGSAANGYYALITVSNPSAATNPLTNLFMTTAYADGQELYAVEIPASDSTVLTMQFNEAKFVTFSYIWNINIQSNVQIQYEGINYNVVSGQIIQQSEVRQISDDEEATEENAGVISKVIPDPSTDSDSSEEGKTFDQEINTTPQENEKDESTSTPETETTPTPATGEMSEGQSDTEYGGEEDEEQIEITTEGEVVDDA